MDFREISRQLDLRELQREMVAEQSNVSLEEEIGDGGMKFERDIAPQILENMNPDGTFIPAPGAKIKTDIIDEKGGHPSQNDHYSVKWKRDNDFGYRCIKQPLSTKSGKVTME